MFPFYVILNQNALSGDSKRRVRFVFFAIRQSLQIENYQEEEIK